MDDSGNEAFVISIGFHHTSIAAYRNEQVVWESQLSVGGVDWMLALKDHLRFARHLLVGRYMAERAILELGTALPLSPERTYVFRGRNLETGLPDAVTLSELEVREQMHSSLQQLADGLTRVFRRVEGYKDAYPPHVPDSLLPALNKNGIVLTGDFGQIPGLAQFIQDALNLAVTSK